MDRVHFVPEEILGGSKGLFLSLYPLITVEVIALRPTFTVRGYYCLGTLFHGDNVTLAAMCLRTLPPRSLSFPRFLPRRREQ